MWEALGFILQDIARERGTAEIAEMLRDRLAFPAGELPMVLTWLKKVGPLVPEASQTGAIVKAYGRYGRRWVWSPRAGQTAAGAVDVSDW